MIHHLTTDWLVSIVWPHHDGYQHKNGREICIFVTTVCWEWWRCELFFSLHVVYWQWVCSVLQWDRGRVPYWPIRVDLWPLISTLRIKEAKPNKSYINYPYHQLTKFYRNLFNIEVRSKMVSANQNIPRVHARCDHEKACIHVFQRAIFRKYQHTKCETHCFSII